MSLRRNPQPWLLLSTLTLTLNACGAEPLNNRVLVVYTKGSVDSQSIANHYARARRIPAANLCAISPDAAGERGLSAPDYNEHVKKPIQRCLTKVGKEKILYIVLAYVRPYIVDPGGGLHAYALDAYLADIWEFYSSTPFNPAPNITHPYYADNRAKDDIYLPFVSLADFRSKPYAPIIYSVWRLDGPEPYIADSLVTKAMRAEAAHGPKGQACIDEREDPTNSPEESYAAGEWDLYRAARFLSAAGFQVLEDKRQTEFGTPPSPLCPNAALYAGWYKLNHYNDAFTWNVGAIGFHLDSLSVNDPRIGDNWAANALKHGITVTSGAMSEPYLMGLPRPSGVFHDLLAGANVGDAFLRNTRFLKWMILNIGDPLYCPFPGGRTAADSSLRKAI